MHTILLIEDDPEIVKLNEKYLTSKGYKILSAECGKTAMDAILNNTIDCIVLDVMLPDVMGFDLCGKIRRICSTPVIFLSCKDNEDDKIQGLSSGGDDYMTKPFSMRELEMRIAAQLRRTSLNQQHEAQMLKKINEQYDALRVMKHDYKHHLNAALELMKSGENDKGLEYLTGLQTELTKYEMPKYCQNQVLNSLFSYYADICRKFEININIKADFPDNFTVPNYELCIVLGNLLENAVEACQKLEANRQIKLIVKPKGEQLAINISNTYDGNIVKDADKFVSTKNNANSGIGLESIAAVVRRYGEMFHIEYDAQWFDVYILWKQDANR